MASLCIVTVAFAALQDLRLPNPKMRASAPRMKMVDLFPDPPTVGGIIVVAPSTQFPAQLDQPSEDIVRTARVTAPPQFFDVVLSDMTPVDLAASAFLALFLWLGPDFVLAWLGVPASNPPGYKLQTWLGAVIDPDGQWLRDRRENLASSAPLQVAVAANVCFAVAGVLLERLLLFGLEDGQFVLSTSICACVGGGMTAIIRKPLLTREERDEQNVAAREFAVFAAERLQPGGTCHETEILRAFRAFYPRYRFRDMSQTVDGVSLSDDAIFKLVRSWSRSLGGVAERSPAGYWKGISIATGEGQVSQLPSM